MNASYHSSTRLSITSLRAFIGFSGGVCNLRGVRAVGSDLFHGDFSGVIVVCTTSRDSAISVLLSTSRMIAKIIGLFHVSDGIFIAWACKGLCFSRLGVWTT
jgi:hypothetical protein